MIKQFLHTGFEVNDLDEAIKMYEYLGFKLTKQFDKPEPQAKAAHMSHANGSIIELWYFTDKAHPEVEFIKQHIALESDDIENDIKQLVDSGYKLVVPIKKGVTMTYAFVQDPSGNNIEIGQRQ